MKKDKIVSFPCKEKGCRGIIDPRRVSRIPIRTGCQSHSIVLVCPTCGRLHWPDSGHAVESLGYEKVFLVHGALENRPLNSVEKIVLIRNIQHECITLLNTGEKGGIIIDFLKTELDFLGTLGHAPDCPAKRNDGSCLCGHSEVCKWLLEHGDEEEDVVTVVA